MSLFTGVNGPFFDNNGMILAFGSVYFGQPNQDAKSNPKVPYTDSTFATPLSATQALTIAGKLQQEVWLNGDYSIIIDDAEGNQIAEYLLYPEPVGGGGGTVDSVVAGGGVTVDATDAANPIVSSDFDADAATTSYTLSAALDSVWRDLSGSGTIDITCPPESDVDLGDEFVHVISNYGDGTVTIVAGTGVTVRPPAGGTLVIPQYSTVGIKKASYAADTYIVFGPTVAT